jgi:hypothetical protein
MDRAKTYAIRHEAWTASGQRNEAQSVALNIRQDSTVDDPAGARAAIASRERSRHGVDGDDEATRHPAVLPGAASVRWASIFAIVAMIALFAILSLADYPRVLRISSADLVFEQNAVALRVPMTRALAARLQVGHPVALEIPINSTQPGSAQAACRIEGRVAGMPQSVGAAPAAGPAIHQLRMAVEPTQRGRCRPLSATPYEARLDLGSDSYASMFAAALFRR